MTALELARQAIARASQRRPGHEASPAEVSEAWERELIIAQALLDLSEAVECVLSDVDGSPWDALCAAQERIGR